jgi:hypothetical protein
MRIRPQEFQGVRTWGIFEGDTFLAYSRTRIGAERAKNELQASIKFQGKRMTQAEIDTRPLDQEPQGTIRKLIWNAVRG